MNQRNVFYASAILSPVLFAVAFGGGLPAGYIGKAVPLVGPYQGLLLNKAVQEELKLSTEQITKINDLAKELRTAANALDPTQLAKKDVELKAKGAKVAAGLLKPDQITRVKQIQLQAAGPVGFLDEEIVDQLKLTAEQAQSVREAYNEGRRKRMLDLIRKKAKNEELQEYNAATMSKLMKILSEEQKAEYSKLSGKAFHGELPVIMGPVLKTEPKKKK